MPEAVRPVAGEHVELDERARVEQVLEPLPRGELAPLVLALDRRLAPRVARLFACELLERPDRARSSMESLAWAGWSATWTARGQVSRAPALTPGPARSGCRTPSSGCTNATVVPRLPGRGASSMTRCPCCLHRARAPRRSRRRGSRRGGCPRPASRRYLATGESSRIGREELHVGVGDLQQRLLDAVATRRPRGARRRSRRCRGSTRSRPRGRARRSRRGRSR